MTSSDSDQDQPQFTWRLTGTNYRSFGSEPFVLEIQGDIVAILGANNTGKSSLLRFFYEFRALFANLGNLTQHNALVLDPGGRIGWSLPPTIQDHRQMFSNSNRRDISIRFEVIRFEKYGVAREADKIDVSVRRGDASASISAPTFRTLRNRR